MYPARGIAELWQPAHTGHFDALGRLLGRTRAALLESLAEPASTHTLARLHGLAPSTVSEHLAVLHEAGLVGRRRHRHTILYHQTSLGTELASGGQAGLPDQAPRGRPGRERGRGLTHLGAFRWLALCWRESLRCTAKPSRGSAPVSPWRRHMGLMDKVKAQATQLAEQTRQAAEQGKAKLDQAQANRRGDQMLRQLGVLVLADRTGRGAPDGQAKIDQLVNDISAYERENGLNLTADPAPQSGVPQQPNPFGGQPQGGQPQGGQPQGGQPQGGGGFQGGGQAPAAAASRVAAPGRSQARPDSASRSSPARTPDLRPADGARAEHSAFPAWSICGRRPARRCGPGRSAAGLAAVCRR